MARGEARLKTSIWQDQDFIGLSSNAQRLYMLALSQPDLSYCGVVSYTPRRWARLAPDTTEKTLERASSELAEARFVLIDEDTEELCIRSFVKHDGLLKSPNLRTAMHRDLASVHSERLRKEITEGLPEGFREPPPKGSGKGLSNGSPEGSHAYDAGPLPQPLAPTPSPSSSSPSDSPPGPPSTAEEEDPAAQETPLGQDVRPFAEGLDKVIESACEVLTRMELEAWQKRQPAEAPPPRSSRELQFMAKVTARKVGEMREAALKLLAEDPHLGPPELAARLAPVDPVSAARDKQLAREEADQRAREASDEINTERKARADELLAKMSTEDAERILAEVRAELGESARASVVAAAVRERVLAEADSEAA
jgi:hypothetical protein